MTHNDSIMNHCPHCDSLCLLSQSEVDMAQATNKAVAITCHQCNAQFGLEHNCPTDTKPARPAGKKKFRGEYIPIGLFSDEQGTYYVRLSDGFEYKK